MIHIQTTMYNTRVEIFYYNFISMITETYEIKTRKEALQKESPSFIKKQFSILAAKI